MPDYEITRYNRYTGDELISALKRYAEARRTSFVTEREFCRFLGVSGTTVSRHFGSWSRFCRQAGVCPAYDRTAQKDELLRNLEIVWDQLGRQPRAKEMKKPLSPISISRYQKVFRTNWYQICTEFLTWKSGGTSLERTSSKEDAVASVQSTEAKRREIPLSLRYDVLKRDGFRCVACGRSPANERGVQLHVDHITAWAQGGKSCMGNLRCLCSDCNLGKGSKA